jgi:hypothetical protein
MSLVEAFFHSTTIKKVLFLLITFLPTCSFGQELITIKDSILHFEIGVPKGWKYGVPKDKSLALMAVSQKKEEKDVPRENFNINVINVGSSDMDITYEAFLNSLKSSEGFEILEKGEKIINGTKYKWMIETHKNYISKEDMNNYVLFTNENGTALILTMVTTSPRFATYKPLFDKVMESLKY